MEKKIYIDVAGADSVLDYYQNNGKVDSRLVMAIMESGKWDIEKIITHEYSLDQLAEAIKMAENPDEALNVVIKY